jgi:hypothetical protein
VSVILHVSLTDRDDGGRYLETLGGLNPFESDLLENASDQSFLVNHWINQTISKRLVIEGGLKIGRPVVSRTWQLLYLGMLSYNNACKIEDTPFPFPY